LNGFSQVLLWLGVGLLFFVLPVLYKYKGYKALWAKRQAAEAEYLAQRQALLDQIKTLEQQG
jgi:type II secretory pathway pseudopilin PulG